MAYGQVDYSRPAIPDDLQPFCVGHLPQWIDRHGIEFQRQIAQDHGPVVKMQGMMGVRILSLHA